MAVGHRLLRRSGRGRLSYVRAEASEGGNTGLPAAAHQPADPSWAIQRLTIIIANYNYAHFVARSVDSALAVKWGDLEVIVVDDGSTDDSVEVLRGYGSQICLIETENRGQREAVNLGFSQSSGDAVIFLDSDDVLPPEVGEAVCAAMKQGVSKVQFCMQRIDENGSPVGSPFPRFARVPSPETIRRWMCRTTAYPTPPGSGNAYSRAFLTKVMPLGDGIGDFADSGLLALAPLLGDVMTVPEVRVGYRRHGDNDSDLGTTPANFFRECERALHRWNYATGVAGLPIDPRMVFRSRELLQFRAAAARVTPKRRLPNDGPFRMAWDAIRSPIVPGPESIGKRIAISAWTLVVLVAPRPVADLCLRKRFGGA